MYKFRIKQITAGSSKTYIPQVFKDESWEDTPKKFDKLDEALEYIKKLKELKDLVRVTYIYPDESDFIL